MGSKKPCVVFVSHGGGPLPLLGDEGHVEMVQHLQQIASEIPKPSAIIVISAHWEEDVLTITSAPNPSLLYDYYGFPEEAYRITYPCQGSPDLAKHVEELFTTAGIESRCDDQRGFDHGLFVPLKIMYPDADIPCIQVSLLKSLNPAEHIHIGSALSDIQYEDLLIVGSGFSFHNMRAFFKPDTSESRTMNATFDQWLIETCSDTTLDETERAERFIHWEQAPYARYCHPREEHLLPLHVCYGVHQTPCRQYVELRILHKKSSLYLW